MVCRSHRQTLRARLPWRRAAASERRLRYSRWEWLDAGRIRHKGLRRLVASGDKSGIRQDRLAKVTRILGALGAATSPQELHLPGWHLHELKGDRRGTYSVRVTANQRITFRWDEDEPYEVDLEDYHGG